MGNLQQSTHTSEHFIHSQVRFIKGPYIMKFLKKQYCFVFDYK